MTASHQTCGESVPPWRGSSVSVSRNGATVVVTVAGVLDHVAAAGLRHILSDVMYGQGNLFVRMDFDVFAEASVLSVLSSLQSAREAAGGPALGGWCLSRGGSTWRAARWARMTALLFWTGGWSWCWVWRGGRGICLMI
jgi:hypothetical protein